MTALALLHTAPLVSQGKSSSSGPDGSSYRQRPTVMVKATLLRVGVVLRQQAAVIVVRLPQGICKLLDMFRAGLRVAWFHSRS